MRAEIVVNMMVPIRCFSCGKPIGDKWDEFQKDAKAGRNLKNTLDRLGLERFCCRSVFLTTVDMMEKVGVFHK